MQELHDQPNEMALYLRPSIERWKSTGLKYQFLQKWRNIDYATRSGHPWCEARLEVKVACRDCPRHAHGMSNSTGNPKSAIRRKDPNPLRRLHGHYTLARENNLVDLMIVGGKHQAIWILAMESRDECPANANGIEFPLAIFVQHIVEPTKQSEVPQYAATSSSKKSIALPPPVTLTPNMAANVHSALPGNKSPMRTPLGAIDLCDKPSKWLAGRRNGMSCIRYIVS